MRLTMCSVAVPKVSCLQSLNIYRQLEIDWFEPMRSILNAMPAAKSFEAAE